MRRAHLAEKLRPKRGQFQDVDMVVTHWKDDSNIAAVMHIAHRNKQALALQVDQAIQYQTTLREATHLVDRGKGI